MPLKTESLQCEREPVNPVVPDKAQCKTLHRARADQSDKEEQLTEQVVAVQSGNIFIICQSSTNDQWHSYSLVDFSEKVEIP